ncbi:MEDS domain-containing protein [Aquibacillus sediminis]|uniref:MEDS domain-containing protein n=1 Tax=Aquibacillus sediminis TaxID=2574734 RepID=UPI001107A971|nr:MEDS domain-containing protein [Aquibacillus sediminis]
MISLTNYLRVTNASHILYFFEEESIYIQNLLTYIRTGIERGHHILIIENTGIYKEVQKKITASFSNEQQHHIHFVDNHSFYKRYHDFNINHVIEHFSEILEPFFNQDLTVRTWAHVDWNEQDDMEDKLEEFEKLADCAVKEMNLLSVCAYNAFDLSASLENKMMRSHEYLMTDREFVRSTLYGIPACKKR